MIYDAHTIARYARGAGFVGDDVGDAVALALATSHGEANYNVRAGVVGAGHWKGLWGVDVDRYGQWAGHDLYAPQVAALAARGLTVEFDGWSWSPVWRAGAHVAYRAHASSASSNLTHAQALEQPFTLLVSGERIHAALDQLAATRAMIAAVRMVRG